MKRGEKQQRTNQGVRAAAVAQERKTELDRTQGPVPSSLQYNRDNTKTVGRSMSVSAASHRKERNAKMIERSEGLFRTVHRSGSPFVTCTTAVDTTHPRKGALKCQY